MALSNRIGRIVSYLEHCYLRYRLRSVFCYHPIDDYVDSTNPRNHAMKDNILIVQLTQIKQEYQAYM